VRSLLPPIQRNPFGGHNRAQSSTAFSSAASSSSSATSSLLVNPNPRGSAASTPLATLINRPASSSNGGNATEFTVVPSNAFFNDATTLSELCHFLAEQPAYW
jgi:hypothetical protein